MTVEIVEVEPEGSVEPESIDFKVGRDEFSEIVHETKELVKETLSEGSVTIIREGGRDPVVKGPGDSKVYFHYNGGDSNASMALAMNDVSRLVVNVIENHLPSESESLGEHTSRTQRESRSSKRDRRREREETRSATGRRSDVQGEPRGSDENGSEADAIIRGDRTEFKPRYTKSEVSYNEPGQGENPHLDCKDCVHFIEGGGCHMVQGEVDPDGHCEDLYADMGMFARLYEGEFEINLALWGDMFEDRFGRVDIQSVGNRVREAISRKF